MKSLSFVILSTIFVINLSLSQGKNEIKNKATKADTIIGYLVDRMCGEKMVMTDVRKSDAKAARHSKDCALDEACSAKGYGLVTGGKFYKFDNPGNKKAKEYLKTTKKENNIKVVVIGTLNNDKLTVESISD